MLENKIKFVYFGSSEFSLKVLKEILKEGFKPELLVTEKDKKVGRGQKISISPLKIFALKNNIEILECDNFDENTEKKLKERNSTFFLIVSYGKIIPKNIINISKKGALNIHGSILPKYRGPSPIQTQILKDDKEIGVSLMRIDEKIDHGPIIAFQKINFDFWPQKASEIFKKMEIEGAKLFKEKINLWLEEKIKEIPQDEKLATYTKKIKKEDGLIELNDNPYKNYLKFCAYDIWPRTFFFKEKNSVKKRVIITDAIFENNIFKIKKVIPEGNKEMTYKDFIRGN